MDQIFKEFRYYNNRREVVIVASQLFALPITGIWAGELFHAHCHVYLEATTKPAVLS